MARGEIHVQLAVNMGEDPKMRALARFGRDARGLRDLFVQMVLYCKRNLTDGFVPDEELGVLVYPDGPKVGKRDADRLVEVGLVRPVEGGYMLPSFLKRNKSKAQVEAESAAKAEAGRQGGRRSGESRRGEAKPKHGASEHEAETKQGASDCLNTESESEVNQSASARAATRWLNDRYNDGLTEFEAAQVIREVRRRAATPIKHLIPYFDAMAEGDLADIVAAVMDRQGVADPAVEPQQARATSTGCAQHPDGAVDPLPAQGMGRCLFCNDRIRRSTRPERSLG